MHRTTVRRVSTTAGSLAAAGLLVAATAGPAAADTPVPEPDRFTSAFTVMATPDEVIDNDGNAVAGEEGATGTFSFRINSDQEIICYDIRLDGVTPPFESPARTATHIHEAAAGEAGPPRLAFPNPEGDGTLTSSGCMQGPFTTGIERDGADTGEGFSLKQIEADPAAFAADTHTSAFAAGAVRGQLSPMPVGGVETGAGGTAASGWSSAAVAGAFGAAGLGALGVVALRRRADVRA